MFVDIISWGSWFNALTLPERIELFQKHPHLFTADFVNVPLGEERLSLWRKQRPFTDNAIWAQRLEIDNLSPPDFLKITSLLPIPLEKIEPLPSWLHFIQQACAADLPPLDYAALPITEAGDPRLLRVFSPLIEWAVAQLSPMMAELNETPAAAGGVDYGRLSQNCVSNLCQKLLGVAEYTLELEYHVADLQGSLSSVADQQKTSTFIEQLCTVEVKRAFWQEYPVLIRLIVQRLQEWLAGSQRFLCRFLQDREQIDRAFALAGDELIGFEDGYGDQHQGESVACLFFASGRKLIYKPRPVDVDVHYEALIARFNQHPGRPALALQSCQTLQRDGYGWVAYVSQQSCKTEAELARFFQRQGYLVGLTYLLNATDMHYENVIASGEFPLIVDLETLLFPNLSTEEETAADFIHTILNIGYVPNWKEHQNRSELVYADHSGLAGMGDTGSANVPTLAGQSVSVFEYVEAICEGFAEMYRWGLEARALLTEWVDHCANDSIRVILRATQDYSSLLQASFHPDWLRDALDRDRLLDRLWVPYHFWPELTAVYALERQQLVAGDIPIFYTAVQSQKLWYGETAVDNIVRHSALFQAQNRLNVLSEADLHRQTWLLRNAINANSFVREERPFSTYQLPPATAPAAPEQLLQWSQRLADQLAALCFETAHEATWFNPVILNFYQRYWKIGPINFDLYDGLSGPALFFAYLSAITGQPAYGSLAQKVLTRARKNLAYHQQVKPVRQIGGFVGLGGYIYTLAHLGALWQQPALWQEAEALLPTINHLIAADEQFGVIDGSGGCILALRSLYKCAPSAAILDTMNRCGEHLRDNAERMPAGCAWLIRGDAEQEKPLTGFSHGTSGIAYALAVLAQLTGHAAYDALANEALRYDNSHYSAEQQNWIDVRSEYADYASRVGEDQPAAWCHGTPGIGLARVGIASVRAPSTDLLNDIDVAVRRTQEDGFGTNHTLCHGDLGNLELLLSASQTLPGGPYTRQTYQIAAQILASLDEYGCIDASPLTIETIGMMTGITGAGYELLRLAYPDKVPSVLLLEPPQVL